MFRLKTLLQVGLIVLGSSVFGFLYQQRFPTEARTLPITDQIEWSTIADRYYGYSFQIPAAWHKEMGVTPDRWTFYGEITSIEGRGIPSTMSKGLIKVDFSADPVGHWLPDPEIRNPNLDERGMATTAALIPLLPHGTWTEIHGMPALIVREKVTEGNGPFVEGTSVYILAERMVYHFWFGYAPPDGTDKTAYAPFFTAARQIEANILESFAIPSEEKISNE